MYTVQVGHLDHVASEALLTIPCSNGCGLDIGVKKGKVVGVRGRATDRVNKGRLGPKGLNGYLVSLIMLHGPC